MESKSDQPRQYKRVRDAERYAREKLGIAQVDYGGDIKIANVANSAFYLGRGKAVPMPTGILSRAFTTREGDNPREVAYYLSVGGRPGEIHVNTAHGIWLDLINAMRSARRENTVSTDDPRHVFMHELGELAMHQSVGPERFDPFSTSYRREEAEFRRRDLEAIKADVSQRAGVNHSEFVAELFAALVLGRNELRQDAELMSAFERFGGKRIVRWTE